ncbi:MAG TPA: TetR/AcrR family transcriptional regulator [Solirubrobacteraceae bacterium]|nr:TetR/AcrR family transcriptional regulator [Solirubrobacteraceae bacterium]
MARNQRARLYGAMIESVARRGYADTTVANVLALAGVSRRAFYELFDNKEDCFLATHDSVVARSRKLTLEAWGRERGWANRLHAGCKALLDDIAASPKGPRLALVDAFGAGPNVLVRIVLAGRVFERMVGFAFSSAPEGPEMSRLTSKAIVGGVRHVLSVRLREGREKELQTLTEEVLDLCEAYHSPFAARLREITEDAGHGRSTVRPPAEFLPLGDDRARSLVSVAHLTFDEGYEELTDPQIAEFAGISTEAFHRHFANKEEAFLALLDEVAKHALERVSERTDGGGSWAQTVQSALEALLDFAATHEGLMRVAFIELFAVGPGVIDRVTGLVDGFTLSLTQGAPEPRHAPLIAEDAVSGALWGVISSGVAGKRLARLPRLVEHLSFIVLAPYIGAEPAFEAIVARRGTQAPG